MIKIKLFGQRQVTICLTIIVLAFVLQTAWNPTIRCVQDEPWVSVPAYTLITNGTFTLFPVNAEQASIAWPPLLQICLAVVYRVFGFGLVQGRYLMTLLGAISVLLSFLIAKELFDDETALLAAAFLAVDNLFFLSARTIRAEILVVTLILLACYLGLRAIKSKRKLLFVLSGMAGAAAMSTHPNGFIGICAVSLLFVFEYKKEIFQRPGLFLYAAGVALGSLPYATYLVLMDLPHHFRAFRSQILTFAPGASGPHWLLDSLRKEVLTRYPRYMLAPYRVHIGVLALLALGAGFASRNWRGRFLSSVIMTHLLLFVLLMTVQKNVRYLALVEPYLAILIASKAIALLRTGILGSRLGDKKGVRVAAFAALLVLWGGTQLIGNVEYHWRFRSTRYYEFTDRIRSLIPENASIYSIVTFWFAFPDRQFYSYNKVPFESAKSRYHPEILLLDDDFMVNGVSGDHSWDHLRAELDDFAVKKGRLLGIVDNWFYGDIKVYRVSYD
jgi:4-amino-4-deoxy-L-arabinose transferase-like glycosyltransferase